MTHSNDIDLQQLGAWVVNQVLIGTVINFVTLHI